ncbi:MAG: hypothetical protein PHU06_00265 [Gallionella sp.]|nr:hypothetical protein [Gallionella sp.]MDD4957823.1 hypothetical protein [Gallionella sp.]
MPLISSKYVLLLLTVIILLSGCGDRYETIQAPGAIAPKLTAVQAALPTINIEKTRALFALASKIEIDDKAGLFELRKEGILIHPGEKSPSKISFKLARSYHKMIAQSFIATLPADATAVKEAGTVGVEFLLDGKSMGRFEVSRDSNNMKTINLTNAELLTVVVDNGDGKPWFDWFMLGVTELK